MDTDQEQVAFAALKTRLERVVHEELVDAGYVSTPRGASTVDFLTRSIVAAVLLEIERSGSTVFNVENHFHNATEAPKVDLVELGTNILWAVAKAARDAAPRG